MRLSKTFKATENVGHATIDGYVTSASLTTDPFFIGHANGITVQCVFPNTGSPVGTFKLQASNDTETQYGQALLNGVADAKVTNFADITNASTAITGSSSPVVITVANTYWRWVRLVYTASSGTITLSCNVTVKGPE